MPEAPGSPPDSPAESANAHLASVRRFYDRNTAAFVTLGQGQAVGAIHRAVWGPGVRTQDEAFRFIEDRIAEAGRALMADATSGEARALRVLDLGCGVGASLAYLATRLPMTGVGITLSPVQVQAGTARLAAQGLAGRVQLIEGSFTNLPPEVGPVDLAYAIESFVHGPDPARFFAEAARVLRPGGVLVLCDDVQRATADPAAPATLARFTRGWHVRSLVDGATRSALAASAGFHHVSTLDLTPWLQLGRPRDRAIDLLLPLVAWLPLEHTRLGHLDGGRALQRALKRGWLAYELAVYRRA